MNILKITFGFLLGLMILGCSLQGPVNPNLFSSQDWVTFGEAEWKYQGKEIVAKIDSGMSGFMTKAIYSDFELMVDFYPDSTINSGIFTRCQERVLSATDCYEFNIWDNHPNQSYRTGALVTHGPPLAHVNCIDQWNTYKIRCEGSQLKAWINNQLVVDQSDDQLEQGFLSLQAAGQGKIRFRNLRFKAL